MVKHWYYCLYLLWMIFLHYFDSYWILVCRYVWRFMTMVKELNIHHVNVSVLFCVLLYFILMFCVMDCSVWLTSAYCSKMIPLATLSTYLPISWASSRWVAGSTGIWMCFFVLLLCLFCFSDHMTSDSLFIFKLFRTAVCVLLGLCLPCSY